MEILQIAPKLPYPPTDGGAVGIFNITKYLSILGHRVTLVTFDSGRGGNADELRKYARVETVAQRPTNSVLGALRTLPLAVPYTVRKYHDQRMERHVLQLLESSEFDLVHVDHLHMAHYGLLAKEKLAIPVFLREHNFETTIWERLTHAKTNPILKWYAHIQWQKMRRYEIQTARQFDCCLMMSREDEARLRLGSSGVRTAVVPAGVDLSFFQPGESGAEEQFSILFLGSLDWLPNMDAFWWFYEFVFPRVASRFPTVKLYVVGKNPPRRLLQLSHPRISVVGFVDDIRPHVHRSQVCVVPLRIGSGMRIKILELLAMSKAIVTTSTGAEGIDLEDGKEVLIADEPESFADRICLLFGDASLRTSIGEAGRKLVSEKYRWEAVVRKLVSVYESTLQKESVPVQP